VEAAHLHAVIHLVQAEVLHQAEDHRPAQAGVHLPVQVADHQDQVTAGNLVNY
jgi:hypothetical protein